MPIQASRRLRGLLGLGPSLGGTTNYSISPVYPTGSSPRSINPIEVGEGRRLSMHPGTFIFDSPLVIQGSRLLRGLLGLGTSLGGTTNHSISPVYPTGRALASFKSIACFLVARPRRIQGLHLKFPIANTRKSPRPCPTGALLYHLEALPTTPSCSYTLLEGPLQVSSPLV